MMLIVKWLHLLSILTMIISVFSKDILLLTNPQTTPAVLKKLKLLGMIALTLIFVTGFILWGPYLKQGWLHTKLLLVALMIGVEATLGKKPEKIKLHLVLYSLLTAAVFFLAIVRPF